METIVDIDWDRAKADNVKNWDSRVPIHEQGYGLAAYDDPSHQSDHVRADLTSLAPYLPDSSIKGLDVCHLQCHIGTDTISLARAGARVTGVDFSPAALAVAARLATRTGAEVTWVEADVLDARAAVGGNFDVVYTSVGTICWLKDLNRWAVQIAALLQPGGVFYIRDTHPVLLALDEQDPNLRLAYRYFGDGRANQWDEEATYAGEGKVAHPRSFEWPHPISEVVSVLLDAGLQIERLSESPVCVWQYSPHMIAVPGGFAWPGKLRDRVPCEFAVVARKPGDLA